MIKGRVGPTDSASVGVRAPGKAASARFSQPSGVVGLPGVPFSMNCCASKCERLGSGEPAAWINASFFSFHSGIRALSAGCSANRPSSCSAPLSAPGFGTAMVGRDS